MYRERRASFWEREPSPRDYQATIATTWQMALDRFPVPAADLLRLCCFLGSESIPRSLLDRQLDDLPGAASAVLGEALEQHQAIVELRKYSLIESTQKEVSVHRLVQAVVRDGLAEEGCRTWLAAALRVVATLTK